MNAHEARYRGVWHPVDVTCRCGWISVGHRSRGEAARSYEGHVWIARRGYVVRSAYGVDARRRSSSS